MKEPVWDLHNVVVGIDGSEQSHHAATVSADLARRNNATLHLVTIVRPPEGWWGIVGSPPTPSALSKSLTDAQREILDAVVAAIDLSGLEVIQVEDVGDPARMLLEYADRVEADVMVIGRRGAGLIERLMLGSVANRVVHDAQCPVLLVP
ncbi:MAG: universal stress protein [Acidimicrobiia bacterium]|nr:universal stress protein [Acidimicrobiia bacterium]MDX2468394.1 universal stress protein [Acidimicrobiia bacterium]